MVLDHSFLLNDVEFDLTDAASRKRNNIYVPEGWKETSIMNAKRGYPKFDDIEVKNSDYSFETKHYKQGEGYWRKLF